MTRRLLTIGECMVELSPAGDGLFAMGFAGDTFNTAWYARQIGGTDLRVGYLSAVGDDDVSSRMTTFMQDAGIETNLKVISGTSVGLYIISLDNGERSFSYWRSASAARRLAEDLKNLPDMKAGDVAMFSGITLAILPEDGRQHFLNVLRDARSSGVQIAFDPNLRPRLWADTQEMCHWISAAAEVADIVLPSFEDEAQFFDDADKEATANRYRNAGAEIVVVKDGPGDVLVVADDQAPVNISPEPVPVVVDTTAAGDAFNAGFLVAYLSGSSLSEATISGCRISAKVIASRGALVAL